MEFSDKQLKIIQSTKPKIIVLSSAASGKTAVLTERIRWLIDQGVDPRGIVAFTFTNAAADEMRKRLDKRGEDVHISTIHSYANYLLMSNGIDTSHLIDQERFDEFFELIAQHPDVTRPVEHLLLDEAQDSNQQQFSFIFDYIKPKNVFIVGDLKQSIYSWNGSDPTLLLNCTMDDSFVVYHLNENYRNGRNILNFAKTIINGSDIEGVPIYDDSICMRDTIIDRVVEIPFSLEAIVRGLKMHSNYKDWFILTRTNAMIDAVMNELRKANIPCDTFKRSQISAADFQEKMAANTVKVLTVHSAKGLEAPNVIVVEVPRWSRNAEETRVAYVAATRAKDTLIWTKRVKPKRPKILKWE